MLQGVGKVRQGKGGLRASAVGLRLPLVRLRLFAGLNVGLQQVPFGFAQGLAPVVMTGLFFWPWIWGLDREQSQRQRAGRPLYLVGRKRR